MDRYRDDDRDDKMKDHIDECKNQLYHFHGT